MMSIFWKHCVVIKLETVVDTDDDDERLLFCCFIEMTKQDEDDEHFLETVCWRPFPISRPKWTIIIIICCF